MPKQQIVAIDKRSMAMTQRRFKELRRLMGGRGTRKEWNDMLTPAAKVIQASMIKHAPMSNEDHYRYTATRGKVLYTSGNLKRSMRVFKNFRKSRAIFVGARVMGRKAVGVKVHRDKHKADAFYAPWVNRRMGYVDRAMADGGAGATQALKKALKRYMTVAIRKAKQKR